MKFKGKILIKKEYIMFEILLGAEASINILDIFKLEFQQFKDCKKYVCCCSLFDFNDFIDELKTIYKTEAKAKEPSAREFNTWVNETCREKCDSCYPDCPMNSSKDSFNCCIHSKPHEFDLRLELYKKHNSSTSFRWTNEEKTEFEV